MRDKGSKINENLPLQFGMVVIWPMLMNCADQMFGKPSCLQCRSPGRATCVGMGFAVQDLHQDKVNEVRLGDKLQVHSN